ncbi:hypothetical protein HanIR_Chr13g0655161 [Helianthus annuus]|nr:hypothetical protein HanIR_Chr13g0655161 [Helianthus annuus]
MPCPCKASFVRIWFCLKTKARKKLRINYKYPKHIENHHPKTQKLLSIDIKGAPTSPRPGSHLGDLNEALALDHHFLDAPNLTQLTSMNNVWKTENI